ncbi:hypothetical protein DRW07_15970 [Alteromonas sediminis]|uniref:Orphan protein n=1 Tax=Alteromonas sediminis TaxID=2259342 RepID=A0A3N5Z8M2_9ALTE|nr:DUF6702 family protein [Alteromonas sediminis]RPJ65398.1 hypothetical protein DRW07_15970 [Alteromonas sediminis]
MIKHNLVRFVSALALFCGLSTGALAHQQKAAITTISYNTNTQSFEVVHRFSLHDAEHAVKRVLNKDADIYSSDETQLEFAKYVQKHFSIALDSGEQIPLISVGHELDGRHFWVYQELLNPVNAQWQIHYSALQEIWPSQVNTVNVEIGSEVRTLVFTLEEPKHSIAISLD